MTSQHNTGTHPFLMTSQHNTGTHPFYIGMYIHICTHIYVHIYTSQQECLCNFKCYPSQYPIVINQDGYGDSKEPSVSPEAVHALLGKDWSLNPRLIVDVHWEDIYIYIYIFFGRVFFKSSAYQWTCHIMPSQLAVVCFQLAFVLGISVGVVTSEGNEPLMTWFSGVDHGATIEAQLHSHRCGHQRSAASCFNPPRDDAIVNVWGQS